MKRLLCLFLLSGGFFLFIFCGNAGTAATAVTEPVAEESDTAIQPTGMIAYMRNSAEIRLIDSNGQNDRRLWTHPNAKDQLGLYDRHGARMERNWHFPADTKQYTRFMQRIFILSVPMVLVSEKLPMHRTIKVSKNTRRER